MKKRFMTILIVFSILLTPSSSLGHDGRTDSSGGHRDNKNKSGLGSYHYHYGGNVEISLSIAEQHRGKGLAGKVLNHLEQQIEIMNFPKYIIATVNASNKYGCIVINILKDKGYCTYCCPIEDTEALLNMGACITLYKRL